MLRNGQVMLVDDEEGVRTSWQRFFRDRGVATTTAPDGASAIDQLSRQPVDVVVSDLRMPGKDGLELLEWLHVRQPDTRFIMLTGYGDKGLEGRVRELGAVDYLEKPVSPDVLARAVERALAADRVTFRPAEAVEQDTAVAGGRRDGRRRQDVAAHDARDDRRGSVAGAGLRRVPAGAGRRDTCLGARAGGQVSTLAGWRLSTACRGAS